MPIPTMMRTGTITTRKPILHLEVRVKNDESSIIRTDLVRDQITEWLIENFAVLTLGQEMTSFGLSDPDAQSLDSIRVIEATGLGDRPALIAPTGECEGEGEGEPIIDPHAFRLDEVDLDVHAYQLRPSQSSSLLGGGGQQDEGMPEARVLSLPNSEFDGLWECLLFDDAVPSRLLTTLSRMLLFSWKKLHSFVINWNRIVLLYGPPGTGKTSLCRALAQKLSIRMARHFPQSKMVEICATSLGSKYFSESSKLVTRLFDAIDALAESEPDTFVAVFIDEIESLTSKREQTLNGNDPFDAMRAVNALLLGLDCIRRRPNVLVLCTSNLITALDAAFFDRIDIKQFIPHPSVRIIYEIYCSCLAALSASGLISGATFDVVEAHDDDGTMAQDVPADDFAPALHCITTPADTLQLPTWPEMQLSYQIFPRSAPRRLADVARASQGLSGRALRRLPALALVMYMDAVCCDIDQAVSALAKAVQRESTTKGAMAMPDEGTV